MFALSEASRTLHKMHPETFPMADSWAKANVNRADISPGKLADRIVLLMKRRKPGKSLMFVVDEVGQFVARDVQKMLDLQAVVQQLGVKGRGKHWIVVTSQEKLNELVSGLDNKNIELARLMDRFPLQVHLEPSDISEVTSRRVLAKNSGAEQALGALFEANRGRLVQNTRIQSDIRLPDVARQSFVDLYPLLPYQIELIIQIVSGLRTQSGASRHVGGANRTIIKLAQQLLINPQTRLASKDVGALVRLDHVYDLVEGNISSDIRAKIASIPSKVDHPKAQAVAKTVCLLQFVKSVGRIGGERRRLPARFRVDAEFLPRGGQGRAGRTDQGVARPRGRRRLSHSDAGGGRLEPDPLLDQPAAGRREQALCRSSEGLLVADPDVQPRRHEVLQGRTDVQRQGGGIGRHHLQRAVRRRPVGRRDALRGRCASAARPTPKSIFWVVTLDEEIRNEMREAYRSQQMIEKKSRDASTSDGTALVADEKGRQRRHHGRTEAAAEGRGAIGPGLVSRQRSQPGRRARTSARPPSASSAPCCPSSTTGSAKPPRRPPTSRRASTRCSRSRTSTAFRRSSANLSLLRDEHGKPVFKTDVTPLSEVMAQITDTGELRRAGDWQVP